MTRPPPEIVAAARAAQAATGILASVSLAQYALESAWGARCTGRFNFFGVKAAPGQPGTLCWTHEVQGGRSVALQALFRDYPDVADAFLEHAQRLCRPPFDAAGALKSDVAGFVDAIGPHYATDPQYAAKLLDLINVDQLQAYDGPAGAFGAAASTEAIS